MKITRGLFDHMVLQRNRRNVSEAEFAGECAAPGTVKALVRSKAGAGKPLPWAAVGKVSPRGWMTGRLTGIAAGGPYDIELRVEGSDGRTLDRLKIRDVLVGDVWVLAGQSNMQGRAVMKAPPKPDARVRAWMMDDAWRVAAEPIHNMDAAVDPVHTALCGGALPAKEKRVTGGPGISFAREMLRRTGVPQGVIACAHGGTSMAQWDPRLKKLGGGSLYGAMLRRFRKNGGKVAGVAWYQGESDAWPAEARLYFGRMKAFIRALRRDLGDSRLPFVAVQLATSRKWPASGAASWNHVQEMQRRLPEAVRNCAVVPAIDLTLGDPIHLDAEGQERLGKRIAEAMAVLKFGAGQGLLPIALKKVSLAEGPLFGSTRVIVAFDRVAGALRSGSRPNGFDAGITLPGDSVFNVRLEGNRAVISVAATRAEAESMLLQYGGGCWPYCNITDSADRSLPVFGPVELGPPGARTPFVLAWRVSRFLPRAGRLERLARPDELSALEFKARTFEGPFCDLHLEIGPRAQEDPLVYFACRLKCAEPMKLAALLGYDGPVKLWVDRRELFHDPNGTNPAFVDMKKIPFAASAGTHEVLVAFGSNGGRAWGIYLRFQRRDVRMKLLRKGPEAYSMPEIVPPT